VIFLFFVVLNVTCIYISVVHLHNKSLKTVYHELYVGVSMKHVELLKLQFH